jgi:hypothetical protein
LLAFFAPLAAGRLSVAFSVTRQFTAIIASPKGETPFYTVLVYGEG